MSAQGNDGKEESLFERIGGLPALRSAVAKLYELVLDDPDLEPLFEGVDIAWLRKRQVQFLGKALGGPTNYRGRTMRAAHAALLIEPWHFDRVAEHLVAALSALNVDTGLIDELLEVVAPLKEEIVTQPRSPRSGPSKAPVRPKRSSGIEAVSGLTAVLDVAQANVFVADAGLNIVYMNDKARETLEEIEEEIENAFDVRVDEVVGGSIHRFHRNSARVEKILKNPAALPHEAIFSFGAVTLKAQINAAREADGGITGYVVTWANVTEQMKAEDEVARFQAMLQNAPTNVMLANKDLEIVFVNPASLRTLKSIEEHLPVAADQVLGSSVDIFHKDPAYQRRILSSDKNLPVRANIQIGPETADLLVSAIYDARGTYLGPMVTWELVTDKIKYQNDLARTQAIADNAPTAVMMADLDLKIVYMNPASIQIAKSIEAHLPVSVEKMVGSSIDIFHKNPSYQRDLLANDKNLPVRANIQIGPETADLLVNPIYDSQGRYMGPMVTWELITQRLEAEEREKRLTADLRSVLSEVAGSAQNLGSSSQELSAVSQQMATNAEETANQATQVSAAAGQVSRNVQSVATGIEEMSASIREIARSANEATRVAGQAVSVAGSTSETISKLGSSSEEIGKVIKVITSIAQQTNLLALNATIEAARAGEAGKGFAVVANEVKELAKETARATEDIGLKIGTIQADTQEVIEAIDEIGKTINKINDIQTAIASSVEEQTATAGDIARNVGEAASGSSQISENIAAVAQVAAGTTEGASSTQSAAADLASMAGALQQLVTQFQNLDEEQGSASRA